MGSAAILCLKVVLRLFQEIVVVEGIHDQQRLISIFPEIECLITNGSEISETTMEMIARANESRGVILFLDPDFPGKRITNRILERVPNVKIAFIQKKDAISKNHKKVGIEHAGETKIRAALENLFSVRESPNDPTTTAELIRLGLVNRDHSAELRKKACEGLGLPLCNGKTFLKYVKMFHIPLTKIVEVIS